MTILPLKEFVESTGQERVKYMFGESLRLKSFSFLFRNLDKGRILALFISSLAPLYSYFVVVLTLWCLPFVPSSL